MSQSDVNGLLTPTSYGPPPETDEVQRPVPQPEEATEGVRLFGATAPVGTFNPVPVVRINGLVVATGPGPDGVVATGLMVVDGFTTTWGRSDIWEQQDPATGQLVIFDPSGTWATGADRRGQLVTVSWEGTAPPAAATPGGIGLGTGSNYPSQLPDAGGFISRVIFRGRIGSPITVRPKTVKVNGVRVRGSLVTLPLVSILLDLANRVPDVAWPEETAAVRAARIVQLAGASLPALLVREFWQPILQGPVAATQQVSLLDHLVNLFDSCGAERFSYLAELQRVEYISKRGYGTARGHGTLWWDPVGAGTGRAGKGVYIRATGNQVVARYLDAGALEYPDNSGMVQRERITRVEVKYPDGAVTPKWEERTIVALVPDADEATLGARALRLDSDITASAYATVAANDVVNMAANEGSSWRLSTFHWSTRRTGGFEDADQAAGLLLAGEETAMYFIQRSWLTGYGLRPVFAIMGQTIGYSRGGWDIDIELAPMSSGPSQHAISWSEVDDGSATYEVQWWDDDHPRGMHESVTYEDLGFVHRGLNVTTAGPDKGFDR